MFLQKSVFRFLFIFTALVSSTFVFAESSPEEVRAKTERYLIQEVAWFQQVIVTGSQTDIRLRQGSEPLIEAVGIWDEEDNLLFPDQESAPHINDVVIAHNQARLKALRNAAQPNAWEAYDIDTDSLLFCANNLSSVCLLVNTDELSKVMNVSKHQLIDALFGKASGFTFSLLHLTFAFVAAILIIAVMMKTLRKGSKDRQQNSSSHLFRMGDMEVDPKRMLVTRSGLSVSITPRDLKLLACLYEHPDEVISKDRLYNAGWGRDFVPNSRSLEQHIMTLRKKIDPDRSRSSLIETVHGQGYRYPLSKL